MFQGTLFSCYTQATLLPCCYASLHKSTYRVSKPPNRIIVQGVRQVLADFAVFYQGLQSSM